VVGLTDLDALTLAMATLARQDGLLPTAAKAIGIGVASNTLFKLGLAVALGRGRYRKFAAAGIGVLAATTAAALWVWW
jgi:uncharacterized membrane protein (DUF4010 family)